MAGGVALHKNLFSFVKWFCRGKWVATSGYYKKFYKIYGRSLSQAYIKARDQGVKNVVIFYVPTKEEEERGEF